MSTTTEGPSPPLRRDAAPLAPGDPLPAWWAGLFEAAPDAAIFMSPWWMGTWLEVYGGQFECQWIRWRDGERVVAGCLLAFGPVRKQLIPMRAMYFNGTAERGHRGPLLEFNDVLAVPGYRDAVCADLAVLIRECRWDCLVLSGYASGSLLDQVSRSLPAALVRRDTRPAPYVDFAALGDTTFEASLNSNTASQIRRSQRLYEARSGPVTLHRAQTEPEALAYLEALARLHNARWESRGLEGSFANPARLAFHRRLIALLIPHKAIDLVRVAAGDADIGYLYNFTLRGKAYSFQSGFIYEQDPKLKPGLLSHRLIAEQYRRDGLREYDFLAGDSRYKRSLAKNERTLHWTTVYRDRPWIRALVWAWKIRQRVKEDGP
jgi:hypothetical protein